MSPTIHDLGIDQLSAEDRLRLIGEIWDSLSRPEKTRIVAGHQAELDRRIEEADANPDAGQPWEEVRARLRGGK